MLSYWVKIYTSTYGWLGWVGGWEEKWRLKLTPVKVEVEVEAELGNMDPAELKKLLMCSGSINLKFLL